MPKPNYHKFPNRNNGAEREFYGDDHRGGDRRVSFKPGRNRAGDKYRNKDYANALRSHLEEEDIDMNIGGAGAGFVKNYRKGKRGRGGRQSSPNPIEMRRLPFSPMGWYRVTIPYGDKYEKTFILKFLLEKIQPLPLCPVAWQTTGGAVIFYVDEYKTAEKLLSLDRKFQLPSGFKMMIRVHPGTPNVDLTLETKEKMKVAMARRYNAVTKALDLTKFHADPDLQDNFCALYKPVVFISVLEIIEANIPFVEAICLNDNKLTVFGFLSGVLSGKKKVAKRFPHIKILHLSNNKIRDITQLDAFIGLPIVDLFLDGNPLCDKYKDQNSYISEVRRRFPKCMKLDGIDLPPPIGFDIAEETNLPDPQQTFLCNTEGEAIVKQFLEQYFLIYDSKNRQPLLAAYHENAMFSFTSAYPYGLGKDKNVSWLNWYQTENRNVLKVLDIDRRWKLLKQGQLSIVSFLQDMPDTKHDIQSFTVDLTLFTPQMICLSISGIFKELNTGHKISPTRFFFRTIVIVPAGSGFCIANEEYHITNATPDQAKEAFKTPSLPQPASGTAAPPSTPEASPLIHAVASPIIDRARQDIVGLLARKTRMNLEWSIKCLEGNEWDYNRACAIFQNLFSQGKVPPEAFAI